MLKVLLAAALVILPVSVFAAGETEQGGSGEQMIKGKAKYVFLFIGDGMGLPQINAAEAFISSKSGKPFESAKLSFSDFPAQGLTTTYAEDRFITDSAAAATAIACGKKTTSGTIAMDGSGSLKYKSIAEMAKEAGMKVGIVSSVNVDHATPASFYAHNPSRGNYYEIGVEGASSKLMDYFAGGMLRTSKTPDGSKTQHEIMQENGWLIADSRSEIMGLSPTNKQVYAYNHGFAFNALDYALDMESDDVSLAEFTAKGIDVLDNPSGFFMMIEGGKIDWACHANDATASIHDTLDFDAAVEEAVKFYNAHPNETLIVVTGDHECGGLTLGFAGTQYESAFTILAGQKGSFEKFNIEVLAPYKKTHSVETASIYDLMDDIEDFFGIKAADLTNVEKEMLSRAFIRSMEGELTRAAAENTYLLYGGYEPLTVTLTHIVNQKAGLAWTSYSHTGVPVPTFAIGVGASQFNGYYDNTDIFFKTVRAMGLKTMVAAK